MKLPKKKKIEVSIVDFSILYTIYFAKILKVLIREGAGKNYSADGVSLRSAFSLVSTGITLER